MLSLIYLLLSVSLITLGVLLWRLKTLQDTHKIASFCLWLGAYACIANAPMFSSFIEPEMATLGNNLSVYVGFPMMSLVLLDLALGWQWLRATWGRIFLALAATIFRLIKTMLPNNQPVKNHFIVLSFYLGLMIASLWSFNTNLALLWNGLTLLIFGGYLYFSASSMALASPLPSPK